MHFYFFSRHLHPQWAQGCRALLTPPCNNGICRSLTPSIKNVNLIYNPPFSPPINMGFLRFVMRRLRAEKQRVLCPMCQARFSEKLELVEPTRSTFKMTRVVLYLANFFNMFWVSATEITNSGSPSSLFQTLV